MSAQGRISITGRFTLYDVNDVRLTMRSLECTGRKNLYSYCKKMIAAGGDRNLVSPISPDCIDEIDRLCPNFHDVSLEIRKAVALSLRERGAIHIPPILLLGKPGIGKTHYASEISKALGVGFEFFPMSSATAGWLLGGASPMWSESGMGKVAQRLIEYQESNPCMFIDELDKAGNDMKYNPIGALYSLLEEETARAFRDEYIGIPIDTSKVTWFATANEEQYIPSSIRNRMIHFFIREPTRDELTMIAREIYAGITARYPRSGFDPQPDDRVIEKLSEMVPRDIRLALTSAFGSAALAKRRHIIPEDICPIGSSQPRMGF